MKKLRSNGPELLKLKAVYGSEYVQNIFSRSLKKTHQRKLTQKLKWTKIAICKCELFFAFDVKNVLLFGYGKFNQNQFTNLCKLALSKFAL